MNERKVYGLLLRLVREEIIFLDKGYGDNKPAKLQEEYGLLQDALSLLNNSVELLNQEEYADAFHQNARH